MSVRTDLQFLEPPPTIWGVWHPFDDTFSSEIGELTQASRPTRLIEQIAQVRELANKSQSEATAGILKDFWNGLEEAVGIKLYDVILKDVALQNKFWKAYREAKPFRIEINATDTITSGLPWELLRSPENDKPFALIYESPVVRRAGVFNQHWPIFNTVIIQVVTASPIGVQPVNMEQEYAAIKHELADLERTGRCKILEPVRDACLSKLGNVLINEKPNVLHIITHGKPGSIQLEDDVSRKPKDVNGLELASVIKKNHPDLSMIVATTCESAALPKVENEFSVAHILSYKGTPVVIGMQFEISEDVADVFTANLYHNLALSSDIDTSLTATRNNIRDLRKSSGEWAAPVLYLATSEPVILFQPLYALALKNLKEYVQIISVINSNIEISLPHPSIQNLEELGKTLIKSQQAIKTMETQITDPVMRSASTDLFVSIKKSLADNLKRSSFMLNALQERTAYKFPLPDLFFEYRNELSEELPKLIVLTIKFTKSFS